MVADGIKISHMFQPIWFKAFFSTYLWLTTGPARGYMQHFWALKLSFTYLWRIDSGLGPSR